MGQGRQQVTVQTECSIDESLCVERLTDLTVHTVQLPPDRETS